MALLNALPEFVLADDAFSPGDSFPLASDPRFRLAARGTSRTLRRTWLDTFDWRLYRAGLTLEHITGPGTAELVLTGRDGELAAAESARGRDSLLSPPGGPGRARSPVLRWPRCAGPAWPGRCRPGRCASSWPR